MSTIAYAIPSKVSDAVLLRLRSLAQKYDYDIAVGFDKPDTDNCEGINEAAATLGWQTLILMRAPADSKVMAFGIQQELDAWELRRKHPPFLDFLRAVDTQLRSVCESYYLIFTDEWYENERVRWQEGCVDDLIVFLKRPGNWYQRLLIVQTGSLLHSSEVPLVYKVVVEETSSTA